MAESLPPTAHLAKRLNHPHYYLNSALCLPLPVVLLASSRASTALTTALLATPVLLSLSVALRKRSDNLGPCPSRLCAASHSPHSRFVSRALDRDSAREHDLAAAPVQPVRLVLLSQAARHLGLVGARVPFRVATCVAFLSATGH